MLNEINKQLDKYNKSVSSVINGYKEPHSIPIGENEDAPVNVPVNHIASSSSIISKQKEKERKQLS